MTVLDTLRRLPGQAPLLSWSFGLLVVVELGALLLLPLLVDDGTYLSWYLTESAEESTESFLQGDHLLTPDSAVGWRSTPLRSVGLWETDSLGARSTGRGEWWDPEVLRVLALGSSVTNGGSGVSNQETITAFLETDRLRTLNFGTMLYGADQARMLYRSRLRALDADVVVLGLDGDPVGALVNTFVPLRRPWETNMPFVKPRYVLVGDELEKVTLSPRVLLRRDARQELADSVAAHDGFYTRFRRFKHLQQTPLLAGLDWGLSRVFNRLGVFQGGETERRERLLLAILHGLRDDVERDGARLVILAMPPGVGDPEADYHRRVRDWRDAGFRVVDGQSAFTGSGRPRGDLFHPDGVHLTPEGNAVLAAALGNALRD